MNYFVYVLRSSRDGKLYTGITSDLERRVREHNAGKNLSTKLRRPLELKYSETLIARAAARKREKYFKTAAGRRFLKSKLE